MKRNIEKRNVSSESSERFAGLTKYISNISDTESYGEWIFDSKNDGSLEHPIQIPFVDFNELVDAFVDEFYQFSESHPEYQLQSYGDILERNGIKWEDEPMRGADVEHLNDLGVLALMMGAIRAERFCDGALLRFFKDGYMLKWLKRLKAIDCR
ncbi:MAG: hypothetical protein JJE18_08095 [Eubacteriaceae bacterium]|nr:hypothetical protein [Eubacteriaceae bacterium]